MKIKIYNIQHISTFLNSNDILYIVEFASIKRLSKYTSKVSISLLKKIIDYTLII